MAKRDNALSVTGPLIKTILFAIFGMWVIAVLWLQFGQIRFTPQKSYSAIFTSASGLIESAPVTASGVAVGRVDKVEVVDNDLAKVDFLIEATVPMTEGTLARIRFKNLTGDQFLDLTPGDPSKPALEDGGTLAVSQTTPALDIDVLLGGFDPLFQGLQPEQVNQLASNLVGVFEGQGPTINQVLAQAASFSGSLADQDKVIGSVITNFNTVLGNLDTHSADLSGTVEQARNVVSQLSQNRTELTDGLARTSRLANQLGKVAETLRTGHDTFKELERAAGLLADSKDEIDRVSGLLPGAYLRLGRASVEGAAYQINLCKVQVRITGLDGQPFYTPQIGPSDQNPRCTRNNIAPLQGGYVDTPAYGPELAPFGFDNQKSAQLDQNGNTYDAAKPDKDGYVEPKLTNSGGR